MQPTRSSNPPPGFPPRSDPPLSDPPTLPYAYLDFTGTTIGIRVDHIAWECRYKSCNTVNDMVQTYCKECNMRRRPLADALGDFHTYIGFLRWVDPRGNEHWHYHNVPTLIQMLKGIPPSNLSPLGSGPLSPFRSPDRSSRNPENGVPPSNRSDEAGPMDSAPEPSEVGDAVGANGGAREVRAGDGHEVRHTEGRVSNGCNGEVNDEHLEEPEEQEEEDAQSEIRVEQPAKKAQSKKRKRQPENEGDAKRGAAGRGSGKRKKRA
ncbi:hypothetical protein F25303_988 [Fusarium sp. NRRL 25303]|nr:hypothetical protein F25303_988 [Fusarium sp. NRRL 25303]